MFGRHQPGAPTCGPSSSTSAGEQGYRPEAVHAAARERATGSAPRSCRTGVGGLRGAVGTPDQIRDYLRRYEECGVDQVIFCSQAGKNQHEHIMESLELFGREVLPEFLERDEKAAEGQGAAARAGHRRRSWPASRPRTTRRCRPTTTRSRRSRGRWPTGSGTDDFHKLLDKFAEDTAAGDNSVITNALR